MYFWILYSVLIVFTQYVFKYFFSAPFFTSSSGFLITHMLDWLILSYRSLKLVSFYAIFSYFSGWVISIFLLYFNWLLCFSNLLLNSFSEFFISVTVLFSSRISILFFFTGFSSLIIFPICSSGIHLPLNPWTHSQ